ncbi:MAG: hypothetical protein H6739_18165 [Alphaproteobacteria bacterium]|nr:hypothetical protein [Alphaproteobacteria bacterium]
MNRDLAPETAMRVIPLLSLLAAGCWGTPEVCEPTQIIDDTGSPNLSEQCDYIDNDGDGLVDEGYPDLDGDGEPNCLPLPETCDFLDNDYDGLVDEGYPDLNGDGIPDCLDCPVEECSAETDLPLDPSCGGGVITQGPDFWDPEIEFQWAGYTFGVSTYYDDSYGGPYVSPFFDTDSNGVVDGLDRPMVIHQAGDGNPSQADLFFSDGAVMVLDYVGGHTGTYNEYMHSSFPAFVNSGHRTNLDPECGVAVADLDLDGRPEIVGIYDTGEVVGIDNDGSVMWVSAQSLDVPYIADPSTGELVVGAPVQPTVADLDGDGVPEVIAYDLVLDGVNGNLISTLAFDHTITVTMPAIADIDLDGEQEILIGGECFYWDGTPCWSSPTGVIGSLDTGHWNAIVQADSDDNPEIIAVGDGSWGLYEHDGTETVFTPVTSEVSMGAPCVADFDGDGEPELGVSAQYEFFVYDLDGTQLWTLPIDDNGRVYTPPNASDDIEAPPGWATCSGFDFDNDGAFELLLGDQEELFILDGATGSILWSYENYISDTTLNYPKIADYDADGSAEILIATDNDSDITQPPGLTVIGHPNGDWAQGGPGWQLHDYAATNIGPAGEVPLPLNNRYWLEDNLYRARPAEPTEADLFVQIVDVCVEDCSNAGSYGVASVRVGNEGTASAGGQIRIELFGESDGGELVDLGAQSRYILNDPNVPASQVGSIASGTSLDCILLYFSASDIVDHDIVDLIAIVDRNNIVEECDETDNYTNWGGDLCL